MSQPEQVPDYFFVLEDPGNKLANVYASGEGREVLSSVARIALLRMAFTESQDSDFNFNGFDHYRYGRLYTSVFKALEGDRHEGPSSPAHLVVNAVALSAILRPKIGKDGYLKTQETNILAQLQAGVRSPESVDREMATRVKDERRLQKLYELDWPFWFNLDGLEIVQPQERRGNVKTSVASNLKLHAVTRRDRQLDPSSKEALFAHMPKNGKVHSVKTLPLVRGSYNQIDLHQSFAHGSMMHETYGYTAPRSSEFIPVLSRLSHKHPARRNAPV